MKHKRMESQSQLCVAPSLPPLCPSMSHLFHGIFHKALSFQEIHVRKKNLALIKTETFILILPDLKQTESL